MPSRRFKSAIAAATLVLATPLPALAQMQGQEQHHAQDDAGSGTPPTPGTGTMRGAIPDGAMMPMMDGSGADVGMMDCPMMTEMMRMHPGMMSQMMRMHPEMMAMMHKRRGAGGAMMGRGTGSGMMMQQGAMGLDSGVVTPVQHLSIDDVRHYFGHRLQLMGNVRLKLGEVTQRDDDTITVVIVTVDDSLVERLEVDRHSGRTTRTQ